MFYAHRCLSKHQNSPVSRTAVIILTICLLFFTASAGLAFAEDGDGTGGGNGDGSGNGKNRNIPLTLVSSSVKDGDTGVPLDPVIQLDFNKNVSNITVLANNKKCFHLTEEGDEAVPIKLTFPDTQLQQEYKKQVFITPKEKLAPETSYRISVDNKITAKNGMVIDNAHTITFTTGTKATSEENAILKKLGDFNTVTYETAYGETADSVPVNVSDLDDPSEDKGMDTASIARISAAAVVLLIIVFTAVFILLRRKRR